MGRATLPDASRLTARIRNAITIHKFVRGPYEKISSNYMRNHMFINDINDFLIIFGDLIYFSLN
jgi:hypothetical protein